MDRKIILKQTYLPELATTISELAAKKEIQQGIDNDSCVLSKLFDSVKIDSSCFIDCSDPRNLVIKAIDKGEKIKSDLKEIMSQYEEPDVFFFNIVPNMQKTVKNKVGNENRFSSTIDFIKVRNTRRDINYDKVEVFIYRSDSEDKPLKSHVIGPIDITGRLYTEGSYRFNWSINNEVDQSLGDSLITLRVRYTFNGETMEDLYTIGDLNEVL